MIELWKDIEGYEGLYQVSNLGRVYSKKTNRFLTMKKGNHGYERVALFKDGKQKFYLKHRLVAQAFIPNPDNLPEVNHKDEDKSNNCVSNLEWCDGKYNCNYGNRNKNGSNNRLGINHKPIPVICLETKEIFNSMSQASKIFYKVNNSNGISRCINKKNKAYKGFHWMYYEDYLKQYNIINLKQDICINV